MTAAVAHCGGTIAAAFVAALKELLPHEHVFAGRGGMDPASVARILFFVLAITIHNFPEGLAVGVGFGGGDIANGAALAIGIGLQNAPEGLTVALCLLGLGYSRGFSFVVALATGRIEPVGGLTGVVAVPSAAALFPRGLTFAAGAMLCIIGHEFIPETDRRGHQNAATEGLVIGLILMTPPDVTPG